MSLFARDHFPCRLNRICLILAVDTLLSGNYDMIGGNAVVLT